MRALALAVLLVACAAPPPVVATPAPTAERGVLTVAALLDLSGPRASIGAAQRDGLQLWLDDWQGRAGVPVKVRYIDVAGSPARLFIALRDAATVEPAQAVIVGSAVGYDDTLGRAIDLAAVPALFTLPLAADPAGRPGGRWAFALAPSLDQIAAAEVRDASERGVLAPALVVSDARDRVDPAAAALEAELERRRLGPLTRIAIPADGSVPPVVRSGLSVLRSIHCTALAPACAAVAQAAQSASAPTFFYLSYLTVPSDLTDHRELVPRAVWPSTRTLLPFDAPPVTPANVARDRFQRAYADRHGPAGSPSATAYDALALLAAAADRAGPDDHGRVRDALETMSMPLIGGTYRFAPDRHAGADPADITLVRWSGSRIAPALAPTRGSGLATPSPSPTVRPSASPSVQPSPRP